MAPCGKVIARRAGISSGQAIANVEDVAQSLPTDTRSRGPDRRSRKAHRPHGDPRFRLRPGDGVPDSFGQLRALVRCRLRCCLRCVRHVRRTCRGRRAEISATTCTSRSGSFVLIGLSGQERDSDHRIAARNIQGSRRSKPRSKPRGCASGRCDMTSLAFVLACCRSCLPVARAPVHRRSMGTGVFAG